MSLVTSARIMHLPEKGGEDLSHTLKEVEDFGRDQPFDQVLFVESRCKKNDAHFVNSRLCSSSSPPKYAPPGDGQQGSGQYA